MGLGSKLSPELLTNETVDTIGRCWPGELDTRCEALGRLDAEATAADRIANGELAATSGMSPFNPRARCVPAVGCGPHFRKTAQRMRRMDLSAIQMGSSTPCAVSSGKKLLVVGGIIGSVTSAFSDSLTCVSLLVLTFNGSWTTPNQPDLGAKRTMRSTTLR